MIKKLLYICMILPAMLLANNNLEITLEHNTTSKSPLEITLKVTNTSEEPIQIKPSHFAYPDGGVLRDLFSVQEDGEKIKYLGILANVSEQENIILAPGDSYKGYVNLAKIYNTSKGTHNYEIVYNYADKSNTLEVEATITQKYKRHKIRRLRTCNNNELAILTGDHQGAVAATSNVVNSMPSLGSSHALYRKWFGYATAGRYHNVYTNYQRLHAAFNHINYSCASVTRGECKSTYTNAFVYQNEMLTPPPHNIHICPAYWNNSSSRKMNTLIHELSHLVLGTVDGTTSDGNNPYKHANGAQNLASIRPDLAIRNAYSYGYYAPELSTSGGGTTSSVGNVWMTGAYGNNVNISKILSVSKGSKVTVSVSGNTEANYDFIYIYNHKGRLLRKLSGHINTKFTASGKSIKATLTSDGSITDTGVIIKIKRKKSWWEF